MRKWGKLSVFLLFLALLYSCGEPGRDRVKVGPAEIAEWFEEIEEGESVVIDGELIDPDLLAAYAAAASEDLGEDFVPGEIELIKGDFPERAESKSYIIEHRDVYGSHCRHSTGAACPHLGYKGSCARLGIGWIRVSRKFTWGPPPKQIDYYVCRHYDRWNNCCNCRVKVTSIYIDSSDTSFYTRDVDFER